MQALHTALRVGVEEDLLPLSTLLHQRGLRHRIIEDGGQQVLQVEREEQVDLVAALYAQWRSGAVRIELAPSQPLATEQSPDAGEWRRAPLTLLLIVLSVAGFLMATLPPLAPFVSYLSFNPFRIQGEYIQFASMGSEYWRLVTPAFLHFGWLHIAFNCLWLWELGLRIERVIGSFNMLMLFLCTAAVSNACQFLFGGPSLFGGMSGVVFALLGFAWVGASLQPRWRFRPRSSVMLLMLGWLLLCLAGVIEMLGFGAIANAAHVGGLLAGAVLGSIFGLLSRKGAPL